jgi:DNA-binding SARP family transcriptional activator
VDVETARVALLGGFGLDVGAGSMAELPRGVQRLVAYLGLSEHPARAAVAGQLWPDVPEEQAHGSLRSALWRLHKVAPGLVETTGAALALERHVRVDVRETIRWARCVLDPRRDDTETPLPEAALSGELLPGWYDDWVLLERERFRQLRMYAMEALADRLALQGRHGEAVQAAYAAIRTEPLRETAYRTLVRIHLTEGNVAEAVRAYELFRRLLAEEMGAPPSARMEALVAGLRHDRSAHGLISDPSRTRSGATTSTRSAAR